MNCTVCRYELSQCLDGRLPSGRRAIVMQHTASCAPCAEFWDELQAAQQLTLQLPRQYVGENFREQLWERIRAGEGTANAVFREPVPVLAKVRYALSGAAAAAAVLLFFLWLRDDAASDGIGDSRDSTASAAVIGQDNLPNPPTASLARAAVQERNRPEQNSPMEIDPWPMWNSAQPLTTNLWAAETARQMEARYASVDLSLRQLSSRPDAVIVERILTDAGDLRQFAEVLLDLRERDQVSFPDSEVVGDLRLVANMLGSMRLQEQSMDTVRLFVAPTVRQSHRLGNISHLIRVTPPRDSRTETATLIQISSMRSDIFMKLFIPIGQEDVLSKGFGLLRQGRVFQLEDLCGATFVAPRSEVESRMRVR